MSNSSPPLHFQNLAESQLLDLHYDTAGQLILGQTSGEIAPSSMRKLNTQEQAHID